MRREGPVGRTPLPCAPPDGLNGGPPATRETPMPIYYPDILNQRGAARTFSYGDKDVMLYALGIGLGADPLDEKELAFVYEKGLKAFPTAATVLASGATAGAGARVETPPGHRVSDINYLMVVQFD